MAKRLISLICIVLILCAAGVAKADYLSSGNITGTASSSYDSSTWPIEGTYNEHGLDTATKLLHSWSSGGATMWICQSGGDSTASPSGATGYCWAHYQFDKIYHLDKMWGWNGSTGYANGGPENTGQRGFQTTLVQYSTDGTNWTTLGGDTIVFTRAPTSENHSHEDEIDFGGASASEVLIICIDNYGDSYAGLDELRFYLISSAATGPNPENGATGVPVDTKLTWKAGADANSHDVYLGTDQTAVTDANRSSSEFMGNQDANEYSPNLSEATTYYWRVDEVNDGGTAQWPGGVWSFTTESKSGAYISSDNITITASSTWWSVGPGILVDQTGLDAATKLLHETVSATNSWINSGSSDGTSYAAGTVTGYCWVACEFDQVYGLGKLWVWNWNQAATIGRCWKDVTIQYSVDGASWTTLGGSTVQFDKASGIANYAHDWAGPGSNEFDFGGADAKYVVLTAHSSWSESWYGLSELRFHAVFSRAINPSPSDKVVGMDTGVVLSWSPGYHAVSHDVYIGTDFNDVNNATTIRLAGDVDKSGQVDWADVLVLSDQWLQNPEGLEPSADLDDNNNVNFVDLGIVGNDWKKRCEGNQDANSYDPDGLEEGTTYYWRVDEVNVAYENSPWKGDVWSFTTCQSGAANCYYVATDGNDNNPGTFEEPFATLEKARDTIRPLCLPDGGITVYLRGGKYFRGNEFVLDEQDCGRAGKPIVYQSYPGEEARIIGGVQLDPNWFTLVTDANILNRMEAVADGNVMECNLAAHGITDYGQLRDRGFDLWYYDHRFYPSHMELCFNGQIMQLARWPNDSFEYTVSVIDSKTFEYSGTRPQRWTEATEPYTFAYWKAGWVDRTSAIAGIDTGNKRITLAEAPERGIVAPRPWYALNLLEEIDMAGEYYIERDTEMLYFWPPNDINSAEIFVSTLGENKEPLVDMDNVEYVTLRDITFEIGRFDGMRIDNCSNVLVDGCVVRNLGGNGVVIFGGFDSGVQNCEMYGLNQGIGIEAGDRYTLTACNNFARNNHIHDFGRWERCYRPGVYLRGVGCEASHNLIHDAPHFGMWFYHNNHLFQFNEVYNVCRQVDDAGAIYSGNSWGHRGNTIRYNFVHHISSTNPIGGGTGVQGLYLDDCFSSADVFGNIFYDVTGRAVLVGGGRDNIIENNVIVKSNIAHHCDRRGVTWDLGANLLAKIKKYNYQEPPWSVAYPKLAAIPNDVGDPNFAMAEEPQGNAIRYNIGWQNNYWLSGDGFQHYEEISNNIENQDPLFYDEPNLIMALRSDSPAYGISGFERIPWEQIGLLDEHKACRPIPPDGWTNVETDSTLYWAPAFDANSRDVYLGTDFNDVNSGDLSVYKGIFSEPNYTPPGLGFGNIYYWRVDECDANGDTLGAGDVWCFSTPVGP